MEIPITPDQLLEKFARNEGATIINDVESNGDKLFKLIKNLKDKDEE